MGQNFKKCKKQTRIVSLVVASVISLGVGAATLGAFILAFKLLGTQIPIYSYIIAAIAFSISFVVFALLLVPGDRRLAKRLDNEHGLHEKISTMVEFQNSDEPFARLQREDADEKLGRVKFSPWRKKQLVSMILVFVFSFAIFTTSIIVPSATEQLPPEPPLSQFDKEWILAELSDIISSVEKSIVEDSLKASALTELKSLAAFVREHEYLSEMKMRAVKTVIAVSRNLSSTNSAQQIGVALASCRDENVRALGDAFSKLNGNSVQKSITSLMNSMKSMTRDEVGSVADEMNAALSASGADTETPLYVMFKNFVSALYGYSNSGISLIEDAFGTIKNDALTETMQQNLNKLIIQTAISRVCTLFGITSLDLAESGADEDVSTELPTPPATEDEGEDKEDPDQVIGSGGIGSGDRVYGSNDYIYNPYTNTYVPYGEVFDEYNNRILQSIQDGIIPPDFEEFTKEYFKSLSAYNPETPESGN